MEIGLRLIMIGTVILVASALGLFILTGQYTKYTDFLNSSKSGSSCDVYMSKGDCSRHRQCSWSESDCLANNPRNVESCSGQDQQVCQAVSECKWISGSSSCLNPSEVSCQGLSQTKCQALSKCDWEGTGASVSGPPCQQSSN